jgi:GNAT superfamily N-acetyltransferase
VTDLDWTSILAHSLGWVTAHENGRLVGFVNVAWDEGLHAFLLDRVVHPSFRHQGIGSALVRRAVGLARDAGAEWVHVDFDPELGPFYGACGFRPTPAGLIELRTD